MLRLKDKIEANVTYSDHAGTADSAKVAAKLGSAGVGNMANFIYLNAGIPTASNSTIGGSTVPIYMKSGVMTQCIYSLKDACSKSVRTKSSIGDSGWKDNDTDDGYVPTMSFMAYWNGAYSGSSSNLSYCKYGAFGSIVTKNSGDYAPASHTHTKSQITDFPTSLKNPSALTIQTNGTTAATYDGSAAKTVNITPSNIGAAASSHTHSYLPLSGGTLTGQVNFGSASYYVKSDGTANFKTVTGAVYNDYAEFFPRGEATEPGDIVALDLTADHESYIKATATSKIVAGVHSDEYAMLIGGDRVDDGNYVEKNIEKYIPVSLCGRVYCKCIGKIHRGDTIVVSDIPGIGRAKLPNDYVENTQIVGYAVDEDMNEEIRRVRIRVKG